MKNKKNIIIGIMTIFITILILAFVVPSIHEKECKNRVFEDMSVKASTLEQSVIGIIPEKTGDGITSHNGYGSGVFFDKKQNTYYAVTAAHVVEDTQSSYKVFTRNTAFQGQTVVVNENTGIQFEIPNEAYYDSLLAGKVEFISDTTDIAIISFETEEDLPILSFEDKELIKGMKLMCIGHPEGNRYQKSYGYVKTGLQNVIAFTKSTGKVRKDKVIMHDAYLNYGNSGGVAISENMKIAGINVGGSFSLTGYFSKGHMIPWNIVKENIQKWESSIK